MAGLHYDFINDPPVHAEADCTGVDTVPSGGSTQPHTPRELKDMMKMMTADEETGASA